jgi:hypothetical protein
MASDEGRALWELYRPFDAEEKSRLFNGVSRRMRAESDRRRRSRVRDAVAGALAMAAASGGLYLGFGRSPSPMWDAAWGTPLGRNSREFTLHDPDDRLDTTITTHTPQGSVRSPLAVRGAALIRGREHVKVNLMARRDEDNDFYLAKTKKEMFPCVREGTWDLVVVVGPEGNDLSAEEVIALSDQKVIAAPNKGGSPKDPYRVLRATLKLIGPATRADGTPCDGNAP